MGIVLRFLMRSLARRTGRRLAGAAIRRWLQRGGRLAILLAGLTGSLAAGAPHAQTPVAPSAEGIVVVDLDQALNESVAGRGIHARAQELRDELQADADRHEAELRAEEVEIAGLRDTLNAIDFEARVRDFEARIEEIRQSVQQRGQAIDAGFRRAFLELAREAEAALVQVAAEREIRMIFDRRTVLLHAVPDYTEALIEALDAAVQEVPLLLDEADE